MEHELGFFCQKCGAPLEDRPPVDEDWRTPPGVTERLCGGCLEKVIKNKLINDVVFGKLLKDFDKNAPFDECFPAWRAIKALHVIGPLGEPKCPKCGGEGEKRGSWEQGPFWWECDECGEQWGHA